MIEAAFYSSVPLILTALGGLLSERAGALNISLEGNIAVGAFITAVLVSVGFPWWTAMIAAAFTGILAGGLLGVLHLGWGANLFIAGLGINLLLPAVNSLVSRFFFNFEGVLRLASRELDMLPWLMIPSGIIISLVLYSSSYGRRIRAAASGVEFLAERGISVRLLRISVLFISSGMAALAGSIISLRLGVFVPGMSAGKGWIALAMIWTGYRNPAGVLISCYIFSLFEIVSGRIQGLAAGWASVMPALPYLGALLILVLLSLKDRKSRSQRYEFFK